MHARSRRRRPMLLLATVLLRAACAAAQSTDATNSSSPSGQCDASGICVYVPLATPWTYKVDLNNPWPQYPRPQLARKRWQSLNGIWEYESFGASDTTPPPFNQTLSQQIVVPFPVEAGLSGIGAGNHPSDNVRMYYRRTFTLPSDWTSDSNTKYQINFGAVDWESEVYVNGNSLGVHRGGYDKFAYDITAAVQAGPEGLEGSHELIVRVYDPTTMNPPAIPLGKQSLTPHWIMYTGCSGIWQTVWLEPVQAAFITRLDLIPDIDRNLLAATVHVSRHTSSAAQAYVQALVNGSSVASATGPASQPVNLTIPAPKLWSPDSPFLYDLQAILLDDSGSQTDTVTSYFGMRKIALGQGGPDKSVRPLLNNKFLFNVGVLDQGYWPDGIYTPPTDDAIVFDIKATLDLGFNTIRKHMKVESDRWYYWTDKLGMLVWQDMPSMLLFGPGTVTSSDQTQFLLENRRHIENHLSVPSIVNYQVFNEGWGEFGPEQPTLQAMSYDPSRLFTDASGWVDANVGNMRDNHSYPWCLSPGPTSTRASVCGEYGGACLEITGHSMLANASCFTNLDKQSQLQAFVVEHQNAVRGLMDSAGLSGSIYTEITDVEGERNGFWTYDRQVNKLTDPGAIKAINQGIVGASKAYSVNSAGIPASS